MAALNIEQAMTWAIAQQGLSAPAKAVLMLLAWALHDGRRPLRQAWVAAHTSLGVKVVRRALGELEDAGLIRQTRSARDRETGRRSPNIIALLATWGDAVSPPVPSSRFTGEQDSDAHRLFDWMLTQEPAGVAPRDIVRKMRTAAIAGPAVAELVDLGLAEELGDRSRRVRLTTFGLGDTPVSLAELPN